jgi:hypothetical protein
MERLQDIGALHVSSRAGSTVRRTLRHALSTSAPKGSIGDGLLARGTGSLRTDLMAFMHDAEPPRPRVETLGVG